ncbi:hypothetical protein C8Q77DRAFT_1114580 [Trametes polyzona]|nr:hypothetical protein C8Q77DRAFT_1114580 [Trametes polyzona]
MAVALLSAVHFYLLAVSTSGPPRTTSVRHLWPSTTSPTTRPLCDGFCQYRGWRVHMVCCLLDALAAHHWTAPQRSASRPYRNPCNGLWASGASSASLMHGGTWVALPP